jgi:proline iminopeptidase
MKTEINVGGASWFDSAVPPGTTDQTLMIESASAKLFTVVYPKAGAETVVLLHGGPGVPMDFSPIVEILMKKYQVIAFDQRGTGRSPAEGATYSMDEYIKDVDAVTRHFQVSRFHLFGHSWGGLYAQIYAEKYPQNILSLFLSGPASGTGKLWKRTESEVMAFNREHSSIWVWTMMGVASLLGMLGSDRAYQSLFRRVLKNYNGEFDPSFITTDAMVENVRAIPINRTRSQIVRYTPLRDAPEFDFPIMIAYGQRDIYAESKQSVKRRYPGATVVEIENAGHLPWIHNRNEFNNILTLFFHISDEKSGSLLK